MAKLLRIRLIQLKRELNDVGPGIFLILGLLFFLVLAAYKAYQKTPDAYILTGALFVLCLSFQLKRLDKSFVYNNIQKPRKEIYLEYFVFTFPFAVPCLLSNNWLCYPILLISLAALPQFRYRFKQKTYFKNIGAVILPSNFEWISGFRKSFFYLIPIYILALAFCWVRIFPLFLLWFVTVTIASFYQECEPLQILKEGSMSPQKFLKRKMIQHSKMLFLLYAPVLIANTVFNTGNWFVNLLFIPTQIALLCFSICLKYSNYYPNKNLIMNNMILALVSVGSIIPYFLPVPLLMAFDYYSKAKNNLKNYLND